MKNTKYTTWTIQACGDEREWLTMWIGDDRVAKIDTPHDFTPHTWGLNAAAVHAIIDPILATHGYKPSSAINYDCVIDLASGGAVAV